MSQVINTNVSSLFASQALNKSNLGLQTAMQRLSSGVRINTAKDDATGLGIATGYDSQIRGANQAIRNANDGISQFQTDDGYMSQITSNLQRVREIAVQMGGTASGPEAQALGAENLRIMGLVTIAGSTVVSSNGLQVFSVSGIINLATSAQLTTAPFTTSLNTVDADIGAVAFERSLYGADMATLSSAIANLQTQSTNMSAAFSRVMDTDYAAETANMTRNNILQQVGTAMLAQANQQPNAVMTLLR